MKALDVVAILWVAMRPERGSATYAEIGRALELSASQAHDAFRRLIHSQLVVSKSKRVDTGSLLKFLEHGLRYVFPVQPGRLAIGVPTAHSAPPLREMLRFDDEYVWPHAAGEVRGQAIEPLHKAVPMVALKDPSLYEVLALTDALRVGRARERGLALEELSRRISSGSS